VTARSAAITSTTEPPPSRREPKQLHAGEVTPAIGDVANLALEQLNDARVKGGARITYHAPVYHAVIPGAHRA
jgi:hypothetical protein